MGAEQVCPLCEQRISMYSIATGKVLTVDGRLCHIACSQNKTIAEIEARLK